MKPVAVATVQAKPLTTTRVKTVPKRITGLYRLSIVSKTPFEVDIGGRAFKARTLDVFHEKPMFIDGIENAAALDLLNDGKITRAFRLHPGRTAPLKFRVTAHEAMPEQDEFLRKRKMSAIETPLEYKGMVKHVFETLRQDESAFADHSVSGRVGDVLTEAFIGIAAVSLAAGVAMAASSVALAAMAAPVFSPALPAVTMLLTPALFCDPSRTYINGKLFKNLPEVKISISLGAIVGYTSP